MPVLESHAEARERLLHALREQALVVPTKALFVRKEAKSHGLSRHSSLFHG